MFLEILTHLGIVVATFVALEYLYGFKFLMLWTGKLLGHLLKQHGVAPMIGPMFQMFQQITTYQLPPVPKSSTVTYHNGYLRVDTPDGVLLINHNETLDLAMNNYTVEINGTPIKLLGGVNVKVKPSDLGVVVVTNKTTQVNKTFRGNQKLTFCH